MQDSDLRQLSDAAAQALRPYLERSEALRRMLALIGRWLCEEAERSGTCEATKNDPLAPTERTIADAPVAPVPAESEQAAPIEQSESADPHDTATPPPSTPAELVPLKLGNAAAAVPVKGTPEELAQARESAIESDPWADATHAGTVEHVEVDLALVETRCRLKAASCRLLIEKRAAAADWEAEQEVLQRLNEMIERAKSMPNCFLWVLWRERTQPDDAELARIAASYDALADAAALVRRAEALKEIERDDQAGAFQLLAEATSALRVALEQTWLDGDDRDQSDVHLWLRRETTARRVFIERHMTVDDPADPANVNDLRHRISAAHKRLDERENAARAVRNALGQIRYHARLIVKNNPDDSSADWAKIGAAVVRLDELGIRPSDARVAEAVGPTAAALWPGDSTVGSAIAVAVNRARALSTAADDDTEDESSSDDRAWSASVLAVRELLRGKRMVIVGGEPNAAATERLTAAFELTDAEWVALSEHGSSAPMRAPINRPETAVVIVIIKLAGHLHVEKAREFADAADRPCVLLPAGYNPERVATAILAQASGRLRR